MASQQSHRGGHRGGRGGRGGGNRGGTQKGGSGHRDSSSVVEFPIVEHCKYIDTHVHLEYILEKVSQRQGKRMESIASSSDAAPMEKILGSFPAHENFEGCIAVFCDATALSPSLAMWPEFLLDPRVWAAFGLHPHTAQYYTDALESRIIEALMHEKAVAWGECGLDFAKMHSERQVQMDVFKRQIIAAVKIGKPIMVHSRKAAKETFDILAENAPSDHPIHIHCFGDSVQDAENYLKHFSRLYIGFTGMITWDKSDALREVVKFVPLDRILLETDAPYHFPGNNSKAVNHCGTIPAIAATISKVKDVPIEMARLSSFGSFLSETELKWFNVRCGECPSDTETGKLREWLDVSWARSRFAVLDALHPPTFGSSTCDFLAK